MINYFVKFDDLSLTSLQLFSYEERGESRVETKNLADVKDSFIPGSSLFVMLPSALFGFYSTDNDLGLKDEILKANILSESEDGLISDISDLKFFFHPSLKLASWINQNTFNSVAEHFNEFDGDIYFYPEHFLLPDGINSIYICENSFFCAFKDLSGFSGSNESLENYLQVLESDGQDLNALEAFGVEDLDAFNKFRKLNFKKMQFSDLHISFINNQRFNNVNFFQRKFSIIYFKQKLKFNSLEFLGLSFSAVFLLLAPLVISYNLNSSINSYKASTVKIFQQLNPSFKKLVNPRAQIDDLTRNIPKQNTISKQDLSILQYLQRFKDESIKNLSIDLQKQEINIFLEGMPVYKLNALKKILQSEELTFIESGLAKKNESFFGNLLVRYES
ncbi:hypothetical protein N9K90_02930 [Gammaproteobacteria bacterium]|nr:hypothetical protein [Gammaproteobacteria bacterium]